MLLSLARLRRSLASETDQLGHATTYAYGASDDGDRSPTYDAAGRTKTVASSAGTTTLNYYYESRVTSISGPGVSDAFTYNGLDTRTGKADSAGTATYRRDGADVTDEVLSDGNAVYTPGVSQRRSGATTYDLHDQLGSAVKQTSASASLTATRTYDAFGMPVSSSGTPQGPFGFAASSGYQEDGDSGLKLLGHRYYDPSTGRFLTRDPARDGRNWYAYVNNNPLKATDPEGLMLIVLLLPWLPDPQQVGPLNPFGPGIELVPVLPGLPTGVSPLRGPIGPGSGHRGGRGGHPPHRGGRGHRPYKPEPVYPPSHKGRGHRPYRYGGRAS